MTVVLEEVVSVEGNNTSLIGLSNVGEAAVISSA